ncbi:LysR family transcriptional regulator [Pigmentiphaga sp. NML080357]|uniref:LysR family transcriptional regulator n=1 Tax=Pigmentiphaga sp. NML080357 TaxID=2008675 RepID=UPI000B40A5BB|nr:LysR family transcriptional regulator [Pigmentiphaga sp. NML080357]OVZ57444.1 LysR family transcriptional regulator [Pigmentiphaga sp. NML080357]
MGPDNRPLDLEWLEDFVALADSGNFSRAAEARAIAQPAFSRHIRALEEWVGADLVDRGAHPVTLTAAGKRFLPLVEDVLARLVAARIKARMAHDQSVASLRIAATHALSLAFLPRWLARIETGLQLGAVEMMSDTTQGCEELMLQRKVQFLLCHAHGSVPGRLDEAEYPVVRLAADTLIPVCAPSAPGEARYHLGQNGPIPALAYGDASGLGRILRAGLGPAINREQRLRAVFTAPHALLLKALVLEGRGLAWLPESLVAQSIADGQLVVAGDADWHVPVDIRLYRQPVDMAPAAEELWRLATLEDSPSIAGIHST